MSSDSDNSQGRAKKLASLDLVHEAIVKKKLAFAMAWSIPDFAEILAEFSSGEGIPIAGKPFDVKLPSGKTTTWVLNFYPKGNKGGPDGMTDIYVFLTTEVIKLKVSITIGLLDLDGNEKVLNQSTQIMNKAPAYVKASTSTSIFTTEADRLMPEGKLTILVRIEIPLSPATICSHSMPHIQADEKQEDIYTAMLSPGCLDLGAGSVQLVFKDGTQPCHTFPLAARSPVFRNMLTSGKLEQDAGEVQLTDIKLEMGQDLLFFLYNGRLRASSDLVGLLVLADMFEIPELKSCCEEGLEQSVTDTNYQQLLQLSEQRGLPRIKAAVIKYISENANRLQT